MRHAILTSYILYGIRIFLPILILPLLSLRLGLNGFGQILALQSLGLIGSLIVQFGFGSTATRDIAQAKGKAALKAVIGNVLSAQILTSLLAMGFILLASQFNPYGDDKTALLAGAIIIALGAGISPAWYFRGTNRSQSGIALDLTGQIFSVIGIFLFVHNPADLALAAFILGSGPTLTSIFGIAAIRKEIGPFQIGHIGNAVKQLKDSTSLFIVRATSSGVTLGSAWFASLLMTPEEVAYFGVAAKIVSALTSMSQPILYTLMPRAAHLVDRDIKAFFALIKQWAPILMALGIATATAAFSLSPIIIDLLFGKDLMPALNALHMLAWLCIISAVRDILSDIILIPLKADRKVAITSIATFLFILALSIPLALNYATLGIAIARLLGEFFTAFFLFIIATRELKKTNTRKR